MPWCNTFETLSRVKPCLTADALLALAAFISAYLTSHSLAASRVPAEVKAATMRDLQLHYTRVQKPAFEWFNYRGRLFVSHQTAGGDYRRGGCPYVQPDASSTLIVFETIQDVVDADDKFITSRPCES
jgi:hypothetical protein